METRQEGDPPGVHMDAALAVRLDAALAVEGEAYIAAWARCHPEDRPVAMALGGGRLLFAGPDAPVTQAVGLGMAGPVSADELDTLEAFFAERGAPVRLALNPMVDPSLPAELRRRGYRLGEFENAMVRPLAPWTGPGGSAIPDADRLPATPGLTIRRVGPGDLSEWAPTVARGFEGLPRGERPTRMGLVLAEVALYIESAEAYLAEIDGVPAGGACVALHDGIATCFGAATLPEYRGRGVQSALLRHRLALGERAGCDLAVAGAAPGGVSQRNMERLGFRVAYTMVMLELESPGRPR